MKDPDTTNNACPEKYYPVACEDDGKQEVFRNQCLAKHGGYKRVNNKCELIEECYVEPGTFARGFDETPYTCADGTTWPSECVAELYGECVQ